MCCRPSEIRHNKFSLDINQTLKRLRKAILVELRFSSSYDRKISIGLYDNCG
jgi:hypothetical protein